MESTEDQMCTCSPSINMEEEIVLAREGLEESCRMFSEGAPKKKGRPGRTGSLFRLNRKRYAQMKEDGGKMEF